MGAAVPELLEPVPDPCPSDTDPEEDVAGEPASAPYPPEAAGARAATGGPRPRWARQRRSWSDPCRRSLSVGHGPRGDVAGEPDCRSRRWPTRSRAPGGRTRAVAGGHRPGPGSRRRRDGARLAGLPDPVGRAPGVVVAPAPGLRRGPGGGLGGSGVGGDRGDDLAERRRRPPRRRGARGDRELLVGAVHGRGDGLLEGRGGRVRGAVAHRVAGSADLDRAGVEGTEPDGPRRQRALSRRAVGDRAGAGAARRVAEQPDGLHEVRGDAGLQSGPDPGGEVAGHLGALRVAEEHERAGGAPVDVLAHRVGERPDRVGLGRRVRATRGRRRDGHHRELLAELLGERVRDAPQHVRVAALRRRRRRR